VSRRFVKLQQMHWTLRGAHLLLQTRTAVLNDELEGVFRGWSRYFGIEIELLRGPRVAAALPRHPLDPGQRKTAQNRPQATFPILCLYCAYTTAN
jgi:hypothetical protein